MAGIDNISNNGLGNQSIGDPMEVFKNFSAEDIEKIKVLAGLFGIGSSNTAQGQIVQQHVKEQVTVEQAFNEYNKLIEFNLSKKSVDTAKTAERRFLTYIPGNRALKTIERKDAENLMMKISKSAPLGCYNYLKIFRTMFNVFVDWNYISSNPFLKVKLPKRQKEDPVSFTNEQLNIV